MDRKLVDEIVVEGLIDVRENPVTVDEFWAEFISWVEENKWYFGGGMREYHHKEG